MRKWIALIILSVCTIGPMSTGCSTATKNIYRAESASFIICDQAWNWWFDQVVAGKVARAEYAKGCELYAKYYTARNLLVSALEAYNNTIVKDLTPLQTAKETLDKTTAELLEFINTFKK